MPLREMERRIDDAVMRQELDETLIGEVTSVCETIDGVASVLRCLSGILHRLRSRSSPGSGGTRYSDKHQVVLLRLLLLCVNGLDLGHPEPETEEEVGRDVREDFRTSESGGSSFRDSSLEGRGSGRESRGRDSFLRESRGRGSFRSRGSRSSHPREISIARSVFGSTVEEDRESRGSQGSRGSRDSRDSSSRVALGSGGDGGSARPGESMLSTTFASVHSGSGSGFDRSRENSSNDDVVGDSLDASGDGEEEGDGFERRDVTSVLRASVHSSAGSSASSLPIKIKSDTMEECLRLLTHWHTELRVALESRRSALQRVLVEVLPILMAEDEPFATAVIRNLVLQEYASLHYPDEPLSSSVSKSSRKSSVESTKGGGGEEVGGGGDEGGGGDSTHPSSPPTPPTPPTPPASPTSLPPPQSVLLSKDGAKGLWEFLRGHGSDHRTVTATAVLLRYIALRPRVFRKEIVRLMKEGNDARPRRPALTVGAMVLLLRLVLMQDQECCRYLGRWAVGHCLSIACNSFHTFSISSIMAVSLWVAVALLPFAPTYITSDPSTISLLATASIGVLERTLSSPPTPTPSTPPPHLTRQQILFGKEPLGKDEHDMFAPMRRILHSAAPPASEDVDDVSTDSLLFFVGLIDAATLGLQFASILDPPATIKVATTVASDKTIATDSSACLERVVATLSPIAPMVLSALLNPSSSFPRSPPSFFPLLHIQGLLLQAPSPTPSSPHTPVSLIPAPSSTPKPPTVALGSTTNPFIFHDQWVQHIKELLQAERTVLLKRLQNPTTSPPSTTTTTTTASPLSPSSSSSPPPPPPSSLSAMRTIEALFLRHLRQAESWRCRQLRGHLHHSQADTDDIEALREEFVSLEIELEKARDAVEVERAKADAAIKDHARWRQQQSVEITKLQEALARANADRDDALARAEEAARRSAAATSRVADHTTEES